jgi:hypothetical protein
VPFWRSFTRAINNFKSQISNTKWFDKLTTTLSQVEGQITMNNPPAANQTIGV